MLIRMLLDRPVTETVLPLLLEAAPRVALEGDAVWLDVRGLDARIVHRAAVDLLAEVGVQARSGAAHRPIAARVAAEATSPGKLVVVPSGGERRFLSPFALADLGVPEPLLGWLQEVGVSTCGALASLDRESVEVRFGGPAVQWWRWSRADDERRLFIPVPPAHPSASVDFIDYVVTDPERLLFTANALLGGVCDQMRERGSHARRLRLRLPLANGAVWERTLRSARPTADRATWLRLARGVLDRLTVPDSVSGVSIDVEATEAASATQGDLFDAGFATASAVETAVARLLEEQGPVLQAPEVSGHPLVEVRSTYRPLTLHEALAPAPAAVAGPHANDRYTAGPVGLTLQLLPEPQAVTVECAHRRDHVVPVRYLESYRSAARARDTQHGSRRGPRWQEIVHAAGPDRVSGGQWDATYAREYYRAVTADGTLVWLFRDAFTDRWFLHGWWD